VASSNQQFPVMVLLLPIISIILGASLLLFGLRNLYLAHASRDWPSVSGHVISSELNRNRTTDGTTYSAEVLYEYEVGDTIYSSNHIGYGDLSSGNPSSSRRIVNKYPSGGGVNVFYRPNNPEESVIEVGIHGKSFLLPIAGSVFFLSGLVLFVPLLRAARQQ